jgi:hypothetical protein
MGSYALSANIREGKLQQIPNFIQMGRKEGMCSLNDSLLDLVSKGIVEAPEAYQRAISKEEFLKRMGSLPNCRSPKGAAWTEEELLQAAEGAETASGGNGKVAPQTPAERAAAYRVPELVVN